jgi:hypothetical protein
MYKLLHYEGEDHHGVHSQIVLPGAPDLVKIAEPLHDEVQQFIARLRPRGDKTYALVNALGAAEAWACNLNADAFSVASLKYEPEGWSKILPWDVVARRAASKSARYGYTTFYQANAFRHHRNKNYAPHNHPSYGVVVLAVWNDLMKRVELILELDHDLCRCHDGWSIIERLQAGEYLPVSMGCRVKFDRCSYCGHESPTRDTYCNHMNRKDLNFRPRMILPDGQQIFVWNPEPVFFDISFVLVGAEHTAKVTALLSSGARSFVQVPDSSLYQPSADRAAALGYTEDALNKVATFSSPLVHPGVKMADIVKELPPDEAFGRVMPILEKTEPTFSPLLLNQLANENLGHVLGTAAGMGIILKPQEYQRLVLARCGGSGFADALDRTGAIFGPVDEFRSPPQLDAVGVDNIANILNQLVGWRSIFGPVLRKRITIIISGPAESVEPTQTLSTPLLDEISAGYNGYRRSLLDLFSRCQVGEQQDPLAQLFTKKPVATEDGPLAGLFTLGPVAYLLRAHWGLGNKMSPQFERQVAEGNPALVAKLASTMPPSRRSVSSCP